MLAASHSSGQKRADFVQRLTYQPYGASPIGAYEIDRLVSEYNEKNIFSVIWEASQIRNSVEKWFSEALVMAKDMLIRWPGERIKIVRLLDDLLLMNTLLDRNKELFVSGSMVMNYLITKNNVDPPFYDQWKNRVQNLLTISTELMQTFHLFSTHLKFIGSLSNMRHLNEILTRSRFFSSTMNFRYGVSCDL